MRHFSLLLIALWTALPLQIQAATVRHPNMIVILADDLGYSDIGCYGSEIHTPNLDRLAAKGIRFTQFYNTARCCPTRASLLTGLYPHQAGMGYMSDPAPYSAKNWINDWYQGDLRADTVTLGEVLQIAGYRTYMTGKWHVTKDLEGAGKNNWPRQRGFDRFFGTITGGGSYFDPSTLTADNKAIPPGKNFYYTDAIGEHGAQFIREHQGDRPFFLYVAFTAPHWPLHAKPQDIAKYKGRYGKGWDALRQERYRRQVQMGLVKDIWPLSPRDSAAAAWQDTEQQAWFERRMEVYAAQVDCLDQNVGRIVTALQDTGQFENTLILFLSDNGGCAEAIGSEGPPRNVAGKAESLKPMGPEELQFALKPPVTRDGRPVREGIGVMPGADDTYLSYGLPWANVSDTPFRYFKHFVHEGGISTPLIVHWPAAIQRHGAFENQAGHIIDIMATCVDVAAATYPAEFKGHRIQAMEGRSLVPAFSGRKIQRDAPLFWEHEGNRALRSGKWKLVAKGPEGAWELYDMDSDRTELHNIADRQPARVREMLALWEAHACRTHAVPWPWKPPYALETRTGCGAAGAPER